MRIFGNDMSNYTRYDASPKNPADREATEHFLTIDKLEKVMAANKVFSKNDMDLYNRINRFGYIDIYNTDTVLREYLLFTKPDLHLLQDYNTLNPELENNVYIKEVFNRNPNILRSLQGSINNMNNPFMYILSNKCTSKLDIPEISAEENETTSNDRGISMKYRSTSHKSKYDGFDFSLSFDDTDSLDIYHLLKVYDTYVELCKTGEVTPFKRYIVNDNIDNQFSIYKLLISGNDGETILYFAKVTGVYFKNVPRDSMNDPTELGKIAVSMHGWVPEDSDPSILREINILSPVKNNAVMLEMYNPEIAAMDNTWAKYPYIERVSDGRSTRRGVKYDYRLKWTNNVPLNEYANTIV